MDRNDVIREVILSDTLKFACYFFKKQTGKTFVVGLHHRIVCDALNKVLRGETRRLIINIAPRYSKTQLAVKSFIAQGLAINPMSRFLHLSYSGDLAQDNSVEIKEIVESEGYKELFGIKIKDGSNTKSHWVTEQGGEIYATSTLGQITGFGAGLVDDEQGYRFGGAIIIDDPIKPEDALSDLEREKVNRRFETTIRNRVNSRNTPIVIIMQRLHERDLCGYLKSIEPDDWEVLSIPCIKEDGGALWPFKHTVEELYKIKDASPFVFETQYMQNPKPMEGLMYREFQTYDTIPFHKLAKRLNYTDTADEGSDYFCSICYEEHPDKLYVTDVIYTKKTMEYTEPELTKMLFREKTQNCMIESNNGGRIFSRNVERMSREMGNAKTVFKTFPQTHNKQSRIFANSNEVCNLIVFPKNWEALWPEFANAVKSFRKEGRNKNDDAPDVLTGMVEKRSNKRTLTDEEIYNMCL